MQCQKCTQPAVVHLTEIVSNGPQKRAVEIHLCFNHAVEAGLIAGGAPGPVAPEPMVLPKKKPESKSAPPAADTGLPTAIVPSVPPPAGMVLARKDGPGGAGGETQVCPICGNSWGQFKQTGLMGCPHDYAHFEGKILPLVKRAQEGATQHAGKVPQKIRTAQVTREVTTSRLRRELQRAIDAERYEEAAKLRDQLKKLEAN